jgi:hypothetical protein
MSYSRALIFQFISDQDQALVEDELPPSLSRFSPREDVTFQVCLNDDNTSFTFVTDVDETLLITPEMLDQAIINGDTVAFPFEDGNLVLSFWKSVKSKFPS